MNMENYEKVEEFYLDYLEDRETDVTIYEVNNDGSFCSETFIYRNKVLQTFTMTLTWEKENKLKYQTEQRTILLK